MQSNLICGTPEVVEAFLDDSIYYSDRSYVSNSMMGKLRENIHLYAKWLNGEYEYPNKRYFTFGRYFHTYVLEPHKLDMYFSVSDKFKTATAAGFKAEAEKYEMPMELMSINEDIMVKGMVMEIKTRELLSMLIEKSEKEIPYTNEINGVPVKCKVDLQVILDKELVEAIRDTFSDYEVWEGMKLIGDLKSTGGTVNEFPKSARSFDYDRQSAHYMHTAGGDGFFFIPSEKEYPYTPALYWAGQDFLRRGEQKVARDLAFHKELFMDGGYSPDYLYQVQL